MECKTIRNIVSSTSEGKTCGTFNNGRTTIDIQPTLITLDQKQPSKPFKTDNSATEGFLILVMKPKCSKILYLKWHWLRNKKVLDKLIVYWDKVTNNNADYFTKHHPPIHHRQMSPWYIHTSNLVRTIPQTIRLCEGVLNRVLGTQYRIDSLKVILSKLQSMTKKCHTVRRLKRPRQHIIWLINLSSHFKCSSLQHLHLNIDQ